MNLADFDYELPPSHIANQPAFPRDASKLMLINRKTNEISHHIFKELPELLDKNTLLVLNDTRVYPARIYGKKSTGGKVEMLLVKKLENNIWEALTKPGLSEGTIVDFGEFTIEVIEKRERTSLIKPNISEDEFYKILEKTGSIPIPPYIHSSLSRDELKEKYQTVYAKETGSAAAPTAGLHFTSEVFEALRKKGIEVVSLTLHVGLGTFAPIDDEKMKESKLHAEYFEITKEEAEKINAAKKSGKKIISVGTTTLRALESATDDNGLLKPFMGETTIFIKPGYSFRMVDGLITNFHLPKSSLLMLVSAFSSFPNTDVIFTDFSHNVIGKAYEKAIENDYRFFSFGDATLVL